jgi:hydroxymethylpyrimidine/phosphomethylpyrimidine kinase
MTALTAITAQNTLGVNAVYPLPPQAVIDQVQAVVEDIGVDAVKVGMLGDLETIGAVRRALELVGSVPVVVDPVMVSESGAVLLREDARDALRDQILPLATVVTPNLPEARVIAGRSDEDDARQLACRIRDLGPSAVVITGGHRESGSDLYYDGQDFCEIEGERHPDGAAHGSGCTHSSALAAYLAQGHSPLEAARLARVIASEAVRDGLRGIGRGAGPVDALGILGQDPPA